MSETPQTNRLDELQIDAALFGLDDLESEELAKLIEDPTQKADSTMGKASFEMTAAALDLSLLKIEPLPNLLSSKLLAQGKKYCSELRDNSDAKSNEDESARKSSRSIFDSTSDGVNQDRPQAATKSRWSTGDDFDTTVTTSGFTGRELIAWASAAAIAFVAFFVWNTGNSENEIAAAKFGNLQSDYQLIERQLAEMQESTDALVTAEADAKKELRISQGRAELAEVQLENLRNKLNPSGESIYQQLANSSDVIRWEWQDVKKQGVSGEVVWDQAKQIGAMKFEGLQANDPAVSQYQLWIIEENGRPEPVDGGVFDVNGDGVVFVAMKPTLHAAPPKAFAITVEDPGGVVVSKRENLPLLASAAE